MLASDKMRIDTEIELMPKSKINNIGIPYNKNYAVEGSITGLVFDVLIIGGIWDAQKDMLAATIGAIICMTITHWLERNLRANNR